MFLASNCKCPVCAVYFTYTAHVQVLAKNMAASHVHAICIRICIGNRIVAKIILCMCLLYAVMYFKHVLQFTYIWISRDSIWNKTLIFTHCLDTRFYLMERTDERWKLYSVDSQMWSYADRYWMSMNACLNAHQTMQSIHIHT